MAARLLTDQDSYIVKGHYATVGYTEFLRQPVPDTNSSLVDLLLDAGAVLYCKTNLPQTMMVSNLTTTGFLF
jgi:amidase